jgi:hypothetical protein
MDDGKLSRQRVKTTNRDALRDDVFLKIATPWQIWPATERAGERSVFRNGEVPPRVRSYDMTIKSKLLTGAGLLVLSTGFALAAPAIVQDAVNLRAGPGTEFPVITAMPAGAPIDVIGCKDAWCRVAFGRTVGFASRGYLALGGGPVGPRGPGYATFGEGDEYGYEPGDGYSYSGGVTTGYSRGYGGTYGDVGVGADVRTRASVRTRADVRTGADVRTENRGARVDARTNRNRAGNVTSETRTSAQLKGNNPMKSYKSSHNPNLRTDGQATALKGNNPMKNYERTANPNQRTAGPPSAIKGNNPMKMPQRGTATNERSSRPSETTGAAPREERR